MAVGSPGVNGTSIVCSSMDYLYSIEGEHWQPETVRRVVYASALSVSVSNTILILPTSQLLELT